jgi:AraC-like DNA-binding protein
MGGSSGTVVASWTEVARAAVDGGAPVPVLPASTPGADRRVPVSADYRMWERAAALTGEAAFGLRAVAEVGPHVIGLIGYAAFACVDVLAALTCVERLHPLINDAARLEVRLGGGSLRLRSISPIDVGPWPAAEEDAVVAACLGLIRRATGRPVEALAVSFQHRRRGDAAAYEALFGVAPRFGQTETQLVLDAESARLPLLGHDPALARLLELELAAKCRPAADLVARADLVAGVRILLADRQTLATPAPLGHVAAQLKMSPRTLQRRLAATGADFRHILDEVRRELAERLLHDTDWPIKRIADQLGFADERSFRRAFAGWLHQSPASWRQARRAADR